VNVDAEYRWVLNSPPYLWTVNVRPFYLTTVCKVFYPGLPTLLLGLSSLALFRRNLTTLGVRMLSFQRSFLYYLRYLQSRSIARSIINVRNISMPKSLPHVARLITKCVAYISNFSLDFERKATRTFSYTITATNPPRDLTCLRLSSQFYRAQEFSSGKNKWPCKVCNQKTKQHYSQCSNPSNPIQATH